MSLPGINPTTGDIVDEYKMMSDEQVWERIGAANTVQRAWRRTPMVHRAACLDAAARLLEKEKDRYAVLMALEMGKPIREGRAEIEKCAWLCRHVAQTAAGMLAHEIVESDGRKSYVAFLPLGVVLGAMPWNHPFWQVFRFAVPAMMAGNAVLLKHASMVPGSSLAIESLMFRAGFPLALSRCLRIPADRVPSVIDDPRVKAVALTGSKAAGQAVGERAGRLLNAGQSCIAAKRFIVVESVRERFEAQMVEKMKTVKMGDPLEADTEIGPLARRDTLRQQVRRSIDMGARCLLGGAIPEGRGFFYPPTILSGARPGMPVFDEETFGPVAALVSANDETDAIRLANHTRFGLGAAVFTRDLARGERIAAERLDAGTGWFRTWSGTSRRAGPSPCWRVPSITGAISTRTSETGLPRASRAAEQFVLYAPV